MKTHTEVTAYDVQTRQAEIFRRAADGEQFIVTEDGKALVEIRRAPPDRVAVSEAVSVLIALQRRQLASGAGGSLDQLKGLTEEGRD